MLAHLSAATRQYLLITTNYWGFTLTDGALRMLVVLHFHSLGYSPLEVAMLFLFYEIFGVITNLVGGYLGARFGLNRTMNIGLALQLVALSMLMLPDSYLSIAWVMAAQAVSGIAKDLNKMSAKSAIKMLVPEDNSSGLYKWVALLTGSKNALKGLGFFLGGLLLALFGFQGAMMAMALALAIIWLMSLVKLKNDLGKSAFKPKFRQLFSKTPAINHLAAARLFLFAARDVWFVVALPICLMTELGWLSSEVGSFLALWVIGYGAVQSIAPKLTHNQINRNPGVHAASWASCLAIIMLPIALFLNVYGPNTWILVIGLLVFGVAFAINSSLHSFLIVDYADAKGVSLDVGFYYMANACGRLLGTVLSGVTYQQFGLAACLWLSCLFVIIAAAFSLKLKPKI
ncbi:organoarsenical effux MFS transporter ArsJ [Paraferrimonas haliotis]|uniref:MFS transporter n=1 Tax=Paraferrimonas haliotis TaxID=2013866 RepID=A0AA37TP07_9GAMM|nr:organoarsenical effux MFS transporter ArsJ [Paraferrimonas haliotis]GLS84073.1 MFS transporter [Paraferrimonas haliotis]